MAGLFFGALIFATIAYLLVVPALFISAIVRYRAGKRKKAWISGGAFILLIAPLFYMAPWLYFAKKDYNPVKITGWAWKTATKEALVYLPESPPATKAIQIHVCNEHAGLGPGYNRWSRFGFSTEEAYREYQEALLGTQGLKTDSGADCTIVLNPVPQTKYFWHPENVKNPLYVESEDGRCHWIFDDQHCLVYVVAHD